VIVFGPGPVGLLLLQAARAGGAAWIGVVGLTQDARRLEIARTLGADATFVFGDDVTAELRTSTSGGADIILEAAGTPDAMRTTVDALRVGGTAVYAGLPPQRSAQIEAIRVTRDELTIRGVEGNLPADRRRALALLASGAVRCRPFVTHEFSLDDAETAFQTVAAGEACKAVFAVAPA
jgi:threonine dehydrogenase-like Zn-dependent dehydrogenase